MQQKTLIKTVNKIKNLNILDINQIQNEEGSGYYNVWKVVTLDSKYILKQCTENELNNYNNLKSSCIPKFYGYTKYYNKIYILLSLLFIPISMLIRLFSLSFFANIVVIILVCILFYVGILYIRKDDNLLLIFDKIKENC